MKLIKASNNISFINNGGEQAGGISGGNRTNRGLQRELARQCQGMGKKVVGEGGKSGKGIPAPKNKTK